jgi:hypothetical protein
LCRTSRHETTAGGKNIDSVQAKKTFFFTPINRAHLSEFEIFIKRLLMVGPAPCEWNVLRATDGERFVPRGKGYDFSRDLITARIKRWMQSP